MEKVYRDIISALDKGEDFVTAAIVHTEGSVPRKSGTTMMYNSKGEFLGTVGGGSSEKTAQDDCKSAMKEKSSFVRHYNSCHGASSDGMICGGSMSIEFTYVGAENREVYRRKLEKIIEAVQKNTVQVWIAGAGHVAQALVPVLNSLSFDCNVVDDREPLLNNEVFPDAVSLNLIEYKNIADFFQKNVKEKDFICIMTKGHKDDYAALVPALRSKAYYVGLMGSRSKVNALYSSLEKEGFSEGEIKKCHSPIGVNISAETPLEVAVSIAGELIYNRALLEGRNKY